MSLGALARMYGPLAEGREDRPYNRHAMYNSVGRGKLSCTLDVRFPEQRELFMQLVAKSDVFVENLKASTLHQMGIHETELQKVNPRLIVLRIPPAGLTGDWAHYTGFGGQFDGLSSLAALCGHRGTTLMESPSTMHMDSVTGPAAGFALLGALHYRAATGRGQVIELAQMENVVTQLGDVFVDLQLGTEAAAPGQPRPPARAAGHLPVLRRPLARGDGERRRGLARPHRRDGARRSREGGAPRRSRGPSGGARRARRGASARGRSRSPPRRGSTRCSTPAWRPRRIGDDPTFAADPQVAFREWIRPLESRDVGTHNHIGHLFQGVPQVWERGAPTLGQDNEYVFKEVLGLDDAAYERLVADGVAIEDYLDKDGNPY